MAFGDLQITIPGLEEIAAQINRMENRIMGELAQITDLANKTLTFIADVRAKVEQLEALEDELGPQASQIVAELSAAVTAANEAIGDADGSETPPPAPVEE